MFIGDSESEEVPMYCCLTFSYAVKYGFINIDYERNLIEIPLRNLSDDKRQEMTLKLQKHKDWRNRNIISQYIDPDYLYPVHCPWCGLHLNVAIDFEKGCSKIGQYSSKENWEK